MAGGQKQHTDAHRKILLRRQLTRIAGDPDGAAYVPFCGDGDLVSDCWAGREVWAADFDPARTATFADRFPDAHLATGDCDEWPFSGPTSAPLAVLDLDAYAYPYHAWRAATGASPLAPRLVVIFTDGQRQALKRTGHWRDPDGTKRSALTDAGKPDLRQTRLVRTCKPWLVGEARRLGYRVTTVRGYTRHDMLYWGAVLREVDVDG